MDTATLIDLRSDTVTKPTAEMRVAMANAAVEDDVIDVDPSVRSLQERTAQLLGKEAALFMPSGTMTNQIGVRLHCGPGDEFLCEEGCHIYNNEQGAFAQLSQVVARTVKGDRGNLTVDHLEGLVRGISENTVRTTLLCLENTHNRAGGVLLDYESVRQVCEWAHQQGLRTHLDGARLMNAVVASGIAAHDWCSHFDTVSICFSKGLGAPVGSALAGPQSLIPAMRRHRKLFGGGMRQAGIIAAGALYALEHHIDRLADDHENAKILASRISESPLATLEPQAIDTNIVIFRIAPGVWDAATFCAAAKRAGVALLPIGKHQVRAVTHLGISRHDAEQAGTIIVKTLSDTKGSGLFV